MREKVEKWWLGLDKDSFIIFCTIFVIGAVFISNSLYPVARRIGGDAFHFARMHILFSIVSIGILFVISFFNEYQIKLFAKITFSIFILLLIATLVVGEEIKGAKRWIYIFGISVQPSEILKPVFIIINAMILANKKSIFLSFVFWIGTVLFVILQPDFGSFFVFSAVWFIQFFIYGITFWSFIITMICVFGFGIYTYVYMPHVMDRIIRFQNPKDHDTFQIDKAMEAMQSGGFLGKGIGGGIIKYDIPDVHSDFIFALIGEEGGMISCLIVVFLFAFFIIKNIASVIFYKSNDFTFITIIGMVSLIGIQVLINIMSTVGMLPTKGITLPFISYGGSSMVAFGIVFGIIFALTNKKSGLL